MSSASKKRAFEVHGFLSEFVVMVAMFWLQKQQHKNILEVIQIQFKWTTQCNQYFLFVHKACLKVERQCGKNTPQSARALIILGNIYHTKVKCKM